MIDVMMIMNQKEQKWKRECPILKSLAAFAGNVERIIVKRCSL
jgi:hypothetical protein